jgi:hypothetical protein
MADTYRCEHSELCDIADCAAVLAELRELRDENATLRAQLAYTQEGRAEAMAQAEGYQSSAEHYRLSLAHTMAQLADWNRWAEASVRRCSTCVGEAADVPVAGCGAYAPIAQPAHVMHESQP